MKRQVGSLSSALDARGRESCDQKLSKKKKGQHENRNKPGNSYKHKATPDQQTLMGKGTRILGIIDSGASQQMTANRDLLVNYCEFPEPEPVALGDGCSVNAYGDGQVDVTMILGNKEKDQRK
jgi:hypothetical protein